MRKEILGNNVGITIIEGAYFMYGDYHDGAKDIFEFAEWVIRARNMGYDVVYKECSDDGVILLKNSDNSIINSVDPANIRWTSNSFTLEEWVFDCASGFSNEDFVIIVPDNEIYMED